MDPQAPISPLATKWLDDPLRPSVLARAIRSSGSEGTGSSSSLRSVMASFGRDQAAAGAPSSDVVDAVRAALEMLEASAGTEVDRVELYRLALAAWAEERERLVQLDQCLDIFTGLQTSAYLRTRLAQFYDQCAALGVRPSSLEALLSVRLGTARCSATDVLAAMDAAVVHLRRELTSGETAAALSRSVCVALVPVHRVAAVAVSLEAAMATDPQLQEVAWAVTVAPLADGFEQALETLDQTTAEST